MVFDQIEIIAIFLVFFRKYSLRWNEYPSLFLVIFFVLKKKSKFSTSYRNNYQIRRARRETETIQLQSTKLVAVPTSLFYWNKKILKYMVICIPNNYTGMHKLNYIYPKIQVRREPQFIFLYLVNPRSNYGKNLT